MKRDFFVATLFIFVIAIGIYTIIIDRVPPIITVLDDVENEYQVATQLPDFMNIVSVQDNEPGEIEILVSYDKVDMSKTGEYIVEVQAKDKAGNISVKFIKIYVKDLVPPQINGYKDIYHLLGEPLPDYTSHISVYDDNETTTLDMLSYDDSEVDYNTIGTYNVTYTLSDGENLSKVIIKVHVLDHIPNQFVVNIGDTYNMKTKLITEGVIFKEDWLDDVSLIGMMASSGTTLSTTSSNSGDVSNILDDLVIHDENLEAKYHYILDYVHDNYDLSLTSHVSYQLFSFSFVRNFITLPSSYNLDEYQQEVSNEFLLALESLSNNELEYTDFFEEFGTHVIVELSYGIEYSFVCIELDDNYHIEHDETLCNMNSLSLFETNSSSFTISNTDKLSLLAISKVSHLPLEKTNELNSDVLSNWTAENNEYVLIEFGPDDRGLRPIYQAIPDEYEHLRVQMETALNEYLDTIESN